MNKDLLKRVGMLTGGNCRLYSRCFRGAGGEWLTLHEANDRQLVAAAVGRTGRTHRAVRYGLR